MDHQISFIRLAVGVPESSRCKPRRIEASVGRMPNVWQARRAHARLRSSARFENHFERCVACALVGAAVISQDISDALVGATEMQTCAEPDGTTGPHLRSNRNSPRRLELAGCVRDDIRSGEANLVSEIMRRPSRPDVLEFRRGGWPSVRLGQEPPGRVCELSGPAPVASSPHPDVIQIPPLGSKWRCGCGGPPRGTGSPIRGSTRHRDAGLG